MRMRTRRLRLRSRVQRSGARSQSGVAQKTRGLRSGEHYPQYADREPIVQRKARMPANQIASIRSPGQRSLRCASGQALGRAAPRAPSGLTTMTLVRSRFRQRVGLHFLAGRDRDFDATILLPTGLGIVGRNRLTLAATSDLNARRGNTVTLEVSPNG